MPRQGLPAHQGSGPVGRKVLPVVRQDPEPEARDLAVGGVTDDGVDAILGESAVHESVIHFHDLRVELVARREPGIAVLPLDELRGHGDAQRVRGRTADTAEQRERDERGEDGERGPEEAVEALLDRAERRVEDQREESRGHRAGQDERRVRQRDPAKDVHAETACADQRGERRDADADHGGRADAGEDDRERERELDAGEHLPVRHAHACRCLANGGLDVRDTDHGISHDGQERVEKKRNRRGQATDTGEWNQDAEQGEARDCLQHAHRREHD